MKTSPLPCLLVAMLVVSVAGAAAQNEKPAETTEPAPIVEKNKPPTAEEREKKVKEFREKQKQKGPSPEAIAKLREELKNLPPEERAARMKEFRERQKAAALAHPDGDPQAKMRARFEKRVEDLRKKKADGTITGDESKQLERGEQMLKRAGKKRAGSVERPGAEELPVPKVPPSKKSE